LHNLKAPDFSSMTDDALLATLTYMYTRHSVCGGTSRWLPENIAMGPPITMHMLAMALRRHIEEAVRKRTSLWVSIDHVMHVLEYALARAAVAPNERASQPREEDWAVFVDVTRFIYVEKPYTRRILGLLHEHAHYSPLHYLRSGRCQRLRQMVSDERADAAAAAPAATSARKRARAAPK